MELLKPPQPLVLSGSTAKNWSLFKQSFELFLQATEPSKEPRSEAAKTALLLSVAGEDALEKGPQVSEVRDEQDDFYILDVNVGSKADLLINATLASKQVSLKVDTGSQANLLPQSVFQSLKSKSRLRESSSVLRSYSGDAIKHIGATTLQVVANSHTGYFDFFIVKKSTQAILGLSVSEALGLVSRTVDVVNTSSTIQAMTEFPELFQGIGWLKRQYHMVLQGDATPVVQPVRRVPQALLQPLREELYRMEHEGIVVKVSEPTDWVSPFVAARKKDGKQMFLADMLSRSSPVAPGTMDDFTEDVDLHAVSVSSDLI
nr:uncharacterized protein LOC119159786 [Rhipicephalus microplus]